MMLKDLDLSSTQTEVMFLFIFLLLEAMDLKHLKTVKKLYMK
ncbi:UNVERIFIED_CONTAM: hypothetical protein GTU68_029379 [Idotea baltica]|nr:hypothetical protein [Idotea baltica]